MRRVLEGPEARALLLHALARLMLENGAGLRLIQENLGHIKPSTTQIYNQVFIRRLKQIRDATHSAELKSK